MTSLATVLTTSLVTPSAAFLVTFLATLCLASQDLTRCSGC